MFRVFVFVFVTLCSGDPAGQWSQLANAGWSPRSGFQMITSKGAVLVAGGTNGPDMSFNDAYRFQEGSWTPFALSSPQWSARSDFAMAAFGNGTVVLNGGQNQDGGHASLNDVWKLETGTDQWTRLADAPWKNRVGHSVVTCPESAGATERMILTGGGNTRAGIFIKQYNDVWAMDGNGVWTELGAAPWHVRWLHRTSCRSDGKLILAGGHSGFQHFNDVWVMDPQGAWTELTPAAPWSPRSEFGMVIFPDNSLVVGNDDGGTEDVWLLKPDMKTWKSLGKAPYSKRKSYGMALTPDGKRSALVAGGTLLSEGVHNWNEVWRIDVSDDDAADFVLV